MERCRGSSFWLTAPACASPLRAGAVNQRGSGYIGSRSPASRQCSKVSGYPSGMTRVKHTRPRHPVGARCQASTVPGSVTLDDDARPGVHGCAGTRATTRERPGRLWSGRSSLSERHSAVREEVAATEVCVVCRFPARPRGLRLPIRGRRLRVRPVAGVGEAVSLARASDVRTTGRSTNGPAPPRRAGPFACVERAARRGIRTDEPPAARSPGATSATRRWRHPVRSGP